MQLQRLAVIAVIAATSVHAATPDFPDAGDPLIAPRFESAGVGIIPRYVVPTVAQDRAGFMRIATGCGLVRFDSYRFRAQERDSPHRANATSLDPRTAGGARWPPVDRHRMGSPGSL